MLPYYVVVLGVTIGGALLLWSLRPKRVPLREGVVPSAIADLEAGRFRVVGRVVPVRTAPSAIDGARCVYVERARYSRTGNDFYAVLRESEHDWVAHSFVLDDGSGRVAIDPAMVLIDCETLTDDEGLVAERRIREGDEVALVASFRLTASDGADGEGPYRTTACRFELDPAAAEPARLSSATEVNDAVRPLEPARALARAVGAVILGLSLLSSLVPSVPPPTLDALAEAAHAAQQAGASRSSSR